MIKLSIILPIYNVESFLPICLDSLYLQDIEESEYEIICVNDGSTDKSENVIKNYQECHNNLVLINKENGGVSSARNAGLEAAQGLFIWFIDPDDFIRSNCLRFILQSLKETEADICNITFKNVTERQSLSDTKNTKILKRRYISKQIGSCWGHIVKRTMAAVLKEDLHYGEDYLWELETCALAKKQITIFPAVYYYRQRDNSAMHTVSKEKFQRHVQDIHKLAIYYQILKKDKKYNQIKKNLQNRIDLSVQCILILLLKSELTRVEIQNQIKLLTEEKLYPYKPLWFLLKPCIPLKTYFLNLCSFFLFSKYVYQFLINLRRS